MQILEQKGIAVQASAEKIFVDARDSGQQFNFITHAHSDHSNFKRHNKCIMTKPTKALLKHKIRKENEVMEVEYNKPIVIADLSVTFHNSGHILGSSQLFIEGTKTLAITSDIKLEDSLLLKGAQPLHSDILLIESTFGLPQFKFPKREQLYHEIGSWVNSNVKKGSLVILGGYATGKAQELTKLVTEYTNETPVVFEKAFDQNKIYEEQGIYLGNYEKLNGNLKDANVLIVPTNLVDEHLVHSLSKTLNRDVEAAIATGWNFYSKNIKQFPLSDHADYYQLLDYIKQAEPQLVLTNHGFAKEFARSIRKELGIPANELQSKMQSTIQNFS